MNVLRLTGLFCVVFSITTILFADEVRYFPVTAFGENLKSNQDWIALYSKYLESFQEPSLLERSKSSPSSQSYRFLWLRSFHRPISVRLDVGSDGNGQLTINMGNAPGVSSIGG